MPTILPPTDTSRWSLVLHRVTTTSVELWAGTLSTSMSKPSTARLRVVDVLTGAEKKVFNISKRQWRLPFSKLDQRFYVVRKLTGLRPDREYQVFFERKVGPDHYQELRDGMFETLPQRLPPARKGVRPLTIALGSCFYPNRDGGAVSNAYAALYDDGRSATKPHIKFLTGDQVYLDIGFDSLSTRTKELQERIADDYATNWRALGSVLTRGGTWMLPDDHEYWNDYPFYKTINPLLAALQSKKVREAWKFAAKEGVRNIQRSAVVETVNIGKQSSPELSICLADLRSYRGAGTMMHSSVFPKLLDWAKKLKSPGVLVSPQPLIVGKNSTEKNLWSFKDDYEELLWALQQSGHDIVVLSGDVHFGRIAQTQLGNQGAKLIEIVSSPLSNLTHLSGLAAATPKHSPSTFPAGDRNIPGCPPAKVVYESKFDVPTVGATKGYPKRRTKEHFMTIGFTQAAGHVNLVAQSWLVREPKGPKGLPSQGFSSAFRTKLY